MKKEMQLKELQVEKFFTEAGLWISGGAWLVSIAGVPITGITGQQELLVPDLIVFASSAVVSWGLNNLIDSINSRIEEIKTHAN